MRLIGKLVTVVVIPVSAFVNVPEATSPPFPISGRGRVRVPCKIPPTAETIGIFASGLATTGFAALVADGNADGAVGVVESEHAAARTASPRTSILGFRYITFSRRDSPPSNGEERQPRASRPSPRRCF